MTATALWRVDVDGRPCLARGPVDRGPVELLSADVTVDGLLATSGSLLEAVDVATVAGGVPATARLLAPVESQPVWASGVTYERSRVARNEESAGGDHYDRVYEAQRPELFLKALPGRSRGPGESVGIRADSAWDVPEPELALVCNAEGSVVAMTAGNDMSSRSIEGENPLYLPQAKVYRHSCALGPCLVPVDDLDGMRSLVIRLRIARDGRLLYTDEVPVASMRRSPKELVDWLFLADDFPFGVVLLTGTAIVPPPDLTLRPGDVVTVTIPGVGDLTNPVELVGRRAPAAAAPATS